MANRVFSEETLTLQDEADVTVRPLAIGRLRRFMEAWEKIGELEDGDDGFDVFINCSGVALEHNFKGKFDSLKANADEAKKGEFLSGEYKEYLLDVLDLDTIYKILEIAGGIKLNDPKLLEAAMEAQAAQTGKN